MPERFFRFVALLFAFQVMASLGFGQATVPRSSNAIAPQSAAPAAGPQGGAMGAMTQSEYPLLMVDPDHKLQQGDVLSFSIDEDHEPAVMLGVGASGDVRLEFGAVHIAGLTVPEAANALKRYLEKDYYYTATVRLALERVSAAATSGFVYMSGEVNRVGSVQISATRGMHLSEAVLEAGGIGRFGNGHKVTVTRVDKSGQTQTFYKDVDAIIKGKHVDQDMLLQDGDRIYVPRAPIVF